MHIKSGEDLQHIHSNTFLGLSVLLSLIACPGLVWSPYCSRCQGKRLHNEGSAHGAVLKVWHAAVTHTGVSARKQHSVDGCILTDHTVSPPGI